MVALNFSARTVQPNATIEAIPSGTYDAIITNSQEKPTKDSTESNPSSYVEFELTIRSPDPQLNNRKVFDRLNLRNKSQQAMDIAYATLSAICHVTQRYDIQDTAQLHGIPLKIVVAKVARADRPGEFSNDVKGYKDANGNDPGNAGAAAPGGAPQGGFPQQNGYGGAPQGGYNGGAPQGGYPQGGAAPGYPQQTSDQHAQNGAVGSTIGAAPQGYPQQGYPQGAPQGAPPAWAGGGNGAPQQAAPPQGQGAPQGGPAAGAMPPAGAPNSGEAPPPWARPQ